MSKPALFFGFRKKPGAFGLRFVLFCFVMLLGSPTTGQSETNDKLAPQDTVELHVSGWNALIGRFMEAMLINNTFTIDSAGALYLPMIGQIPAAGLREDELAKLITDRLQAMSGLHERAVTTVQRMQHPSPRASGSAERPRNGPDRPSMIVPGAKEPAGAQSSVNGSRMPGRRPGATTQQPVERERTKADALQRSPTPALMQLEMAERRAAMAARADLAAARAQAAQEASAAWRAKQAAEVLANEQSELATRQSAKVVALEQELLAARRQIDALKGSAQKPVAEREEARRALAAVQRELDTMRRVARNGSAQALAVADKRERALEGQRQIADGLARELAAVQREVEGLKAKATLGVLAKAADVKAGLAAEASLADARRVIDHERQKAGMLERDLAVARQSLATLEATADQAVAAEATAMRDLQAAEAATKRLSEALLLQRQRADEATGDLKTARQERDAAKEEAIRVATAQREALEDEKGKAISLARELDAARKEVDSLATHGQRRIENTPKARATVGASASVGIRSKPRSGPRSEVREVRKTEVRRLSRSVALPLPARLLPTRPPM